MVSVADVAKNERSRSIAALGGCWGDHEESVVQPRNAMLLSVELIDQRDQHLLSRELVEIDDQGGGRTV